MPRGGNNQIIAVNKLSDGASYIITCYAAHQTIAGRYSSIYNSSGSYMTIRLISPGDSTYISSTRRPIMPRGGNYQIIAIAKLCDFAPYIITGYTTHQTIDGTTDISCHTTSLTSPGDSSFTTTKCGAKY